MARGETDISSVNFGPRNLPKWVPPGAQAYLAHTENGTAIRALARRAGCHASTIMRQIRRVETRRDDPLVDDALRRLGALLHSPPRPSTPTCAKETPAMRENASEMPDETTFTAEAIRVLRRLCESGAILAFAPEMEKAVVVRDTATGPGTRTAVVDRRIAEALSLKEWIAPTGKGRIVRYHITPTGRGALAEMLAKVENREAQNAGGFAEASTAFEGARSIQENFDGPSRGRRARYGLAESPLIALSRRRGKEGEPFLSEELVHAGERLREDFELAQIGPRLTQDWDQFLTAGIDTGTRGAIPGFSTPAEARARVAAALQDLGPGLSDVVLRCCCYLEGLEAAEKKLGWSARSGKIVLRIALMRLKRHYDETIGPGGPMIG
jgi:hypothetical protein